MFSRRGACLAGGGSFKNLRPRGLVHLLGSLCSQPDACSASGGCSCLYLLFGLFFMVLSMVWLVTRVCMCVCACVCVCVRACVCCVALPCRPDDRALGAQGAYGSASFPPWPTSLDASCCPAFAPAGSRTASSDPPLVQVSWQTRQAYQSLARMGFGQVLGPGAAAADSPRGLSAPRPGLAALARKAAPGVVRVGLLVTLSKAAVGCVLWARGLVLRAVCVRSVCRPRMLPALGARDLQDFRSAAWTLDDVGHVVGPIRCSATGPRLAAGRHCRGSGVCETLSPTPTSRNDSTVHLNFLPSVPPQRQKRENVSRDLFREDPAKPVCGTPDVRAPVNACLRGCQLTPRPADNHVCNAANRHACGPRLRHQRALHRSHPLPGWS